MAHMTSVGEGRLEQLAAECARQVALVARRLAMLLGRGRLERIGAVCGLDERMGSRGRGRGSREGEGNGIRALVQDRVGAEQEHEDRLGEQTQKSGLHTHPSRGASVRELGKAPELKVHNLVLVAVLVPKLVEAVGLADGTLSGQ